MSPPDWENESLKLWCKNAAEVPREIAAGDGGMMQKIATYCMRFGFETKKVIAKISGDAMFAAHFAKDPAKQGIHELIAAEYLRKISMIGDFEILPKGGKNALFIDASGGLRKRGDKSATSAQDSKSLDFFWRTAEFVCYASHKYTKESGGAQDHQFRDQKRFLENFQKHENRRAACFAICDGAYYAADKMDELRAATRKTPPLSFAANVEDVAGKLQELAALKDNSRR